MMVATAMPTSVVAMVAVATLVSYNEFITCFHEFCNYESTIFFQDVSLNAVKYLFC